MISHTFTFKDLFYAQVYRYFKMLTAIIVLFGGFAIGVMVFTGAPIIIGIFLFIAYAIMSIFVMFILLALLAWMQQSFTYQKRTFNYQIKKGEFIICVGSDEIYRNAFKKLTPKVYRKLTYLYDGDTVVAFFPEKVRAQLLNK